MCPLRSSYLREMLRDLPVHVAVRPHQAVLVAH
jgi:hypothetical protein